MYKKYGDIVPAVFTLILSVFYFIMSLNIDVLDKHGGSALIPKICAGLVALCSLTLICQEIIKKCAKPVEDAVRSGEADREKAAEIPPDYKLVTFTLVSITCYAALFGVLGFIVSTTLYLVVQILLLTPERNLKSIVIAAVTAIVVTVLIYLLFYEVFYIVLPMGSLWYNIF